MRPSLRLALAAVLAVPAAAAAAPVPPPPKPDATPAADARRALDEAADFNFDQTPLSEFAKFVRDRFKVDVTVDNAQLLQMGVAENAVPVTVHKRGAKLRDGLRAALAPLGLRHGVTADGLVISTEEGVTTRQMRQRVTLDGKGRTVAEVLGKLADETGAGIVIDPRLTGDKGKADAPIPLKLDDVPLESAVRLAAEVAGLRAVRMGGVLYVTTDERAEKLRPDADGPTQPLQPNPILLQQFGGGIGVFGGVAVPAIAPNAPAQVEAVPEAAPAPVPPPANPPPAPNAPAAPQPPADPAR